MERIKRLLAEAGISDYIVYGYTERTAELFFVKKQLDTRRIKDVEKFVVTVFRTDEQDGKKLRAAICEELHLASLEFQSLEGIIEAIGLPQEKLCTYCWNGKE